MYVMFSCSSQKSVWKTYKQFSFRLTIYRDIGMHREFDKTNFAYNLKTISNYNNKLSSKNEIKDALFIFISYNYQIKRYIHRDLPNL